MKIVLREDVDNVGKKGDLVEVADGYARNFLVPKGKAIVATKGAVKQAETMQRAREAREARDRQAADEVAGRLKSQNIRVGAKAGEGGKLFGSVTASDVADAVLQQLGVELDRRKLELGEPIKELGTHEITLRLHEDVEATFNIVVDAD